MADEKKYLRAILKDARDSLSANYAKALSSRIESAFLDADFYRAAQAIVLYSSLAHEVSTDSIFSAALGSRRKVFFPRLDRARDALALCQVESPLDLAPGAFGILEPVTASIDTELAPSVVLVPGVGFTNRGERMGRGGGHYDRLLAELAPHAITVGLAYSFQLLDAIPKDGWDRRLNFIVTESAIYPALEHVRCESGIRVEGGNPR